VAKFNVGDLVVLKSGSMRMCVEAVDEDVVSTVWCNEGVIGRDNFAVALLNKWEVREDDRGGPRGGGKPPYRGGGDREGGGDRDRGGKPPYRGGGGDRDRGDRGGDRDRGGDDRPPRQTGWDGKPRERKYYRKDDD
jgi:uncharacterized protein YodC (DUF2158 family)